MILSKRNEYGKQYKVDLKFKKQNISLNRLINTINSFINENLTEESFANNILKSSINTRLHKNSLVALINNYINPSITLIELGKKNLGIKKYREEFLKQFVFEFQIN